MYTTLIVISFETFYQTVHHLLILVSTILTLLYTCIKSKHTYIVPPKQIKYCITF